MKSNLLTQAGLPSSLGFLNTLAKETHFLKPWSKLDKDSLFQQARKNTGLTDFGEEDFVPVLEKLLASIQEEAQLHPLGKIITRFRVIGLLEGKLRAQYYFKKHPEILAQALAPPVFITGLQRSGTTFLQRLMGALPPTRALYSWEALNPAPFIGKMHPRRDPRIGIAKQSERALKYLSPSFFAIHPVEHDAPEEEVLLMEQSFRTTVPEATLHVPSFAHWIAQESAIPAYKTLKDLLKLLQWQRVEPSARWILKSPHHLEYLEELKEVFPKAKIIQTHRDPRETIASFCSMVYHSRRIFSDEVNPREIGEHWSNKVGLMLDKAEHFRQNSPSKDILDLQYQDLIQDPEAALRKIYQFLEWDWEPSLSGQIQKAMDQLPQHKYGRHQYDLGDFGLEERALHAKYQGYIQKYWK